MVRLWIRVKIGMAVSLSSCWWSWLKKWLIVWNFLFFSKNVLFLFLFWVSLSLSLFLIYEKIGDAYCDTEVFCAADCKVADLIGFEHDIFDCHGFFSFFFCRFGNA